MHPKAVGKANHIRLRNLLKPFEIVQLGIHPVVGAVKPVPPFDRAMDPERPSDPVPEFIRSHLVLAREYLDAFCQSRASFHRDSQPASEVVDVDPAMPRQHWFGGKDPEVSATP